VRIRNATTQSAWVDAKSILSVLTLGVEPGHEIDLQVEGHDEIAAFASLSQLIQSNFAGKL
jgi:phosphotransferase system HPr (HPr) family protein